MTWILPVLSGARMIISVAIIIALVGCRTVSFILFKVNNNPVRQGLLLFPFIGGKSRAL